jgi:hypothetical protein
VTRERGDQDRLDVRLLVRDLFVGEAQRGEPGREMDLMRSSLERVSVKVRRSSVAISHGAPGR